MVKTSRSAGVGIPCVRVCETSESLKSHPPSRRVIQEMQCRRQRLGILRDVDLALRVVGRKEYMEMFKDL